MWRSRSPATSGEGSRFRVASGRARPVRRLWLGGPPLTAVKGLKQNIWRDEQRSWPPALWEVTANSIFPLFLPTLSQRSRPTPRPVDRSTPKQPDGARRSPKSGRRVARFRLSRSRSPIAPLILLDYVVLAKPRVQVSTQTRTQKTGASERVFTGPTRTKQSYFFPCLCILVFGIASCDQNLVFPCF